MGKPRVGTPALKRLPFHIFQEDQLSSLDGCGIVMLVRVSKYITNLSQFDLLGFQKFIPGPLGIVLFYHLIFYLTNLFFSLIYPAPTLFSVA